MPKTLIYSREDLLKTWRPYEAPSVSNPAVKAILSDEVSLPDILLPDLEPIVQVNSGASATTSSHHHSANSGMRRRGGAAAGAGHRRSDEAPVVKTGEAEQEAGEWHVVGEKKTSHKDVKGKREPGNWRTTRKEDGLSLSFNDDQQAGNFYEEEASHDDKSRLAKLLQSRSTPEVSPVKKLQWFYVDPSGKRQGPFTSDQMSSWRQTGYLGDDLPLAYIYSDSVLPANPQYTPLGVLFPKANGKPFVVAPVGVHPEASKPKAEQAWLWSPAEDAKLGKDEKLAKK